jgi:hypothetical protein
LIDADGAGETFKIVILKSSHRIRVRAAKCDLLG